MEMQCFPRQEIYFYRIIQVFWDVILCRIANTDVWKEQGAFNCRVCMSSTLLLLPDPEDEGPMLLQMSVTI